MASTAWIAVAVIMVVAIIMRGVVSIVAAGRGKVEGSRIDELEELVDQLEGNLIDARQRIEVLEKIVTDGKYNLQQEINDLAAGE